MQALNALPEALLELGKKQFEALHASVSKLNFEPRVLDKPAVWRKGNMRVLDYGTNPSLPPLLVIPSLINRAYILDLYDKRSFMKQLSKTTSPLLVDWGNPSVLEREFDARDYVEQMLLPALEYVAKVTGKKVHVAGYCMGGVLALGLATLAPDKVASIGLLATPWDFLSSDSRIPRLTEPLLQLTEKRFLNMQEVPANWIQTLFTLQHMDALLEKYERFAEMSENDPAYPEFVALEQWLNDSVPLARKVAVDCLIDWAQRNTLANSKWMARPQDLSHKTFIAAPVHDQIVPRGSAVALHALMPHATLIEPETGHVGMIIGSNAAQCLKPYTTFLETC